MDDLLTSTLEPDRTAATAVPRFSIQRRQGPWRDALLRRMLALADLLAVLAASGALTVAAGTVNHALWTALSAPLWLVVAKVLELYDHDQRSLRHLTVDELARILAWALVGTALLGFFLTITPAGGLSAGEAVRAIAAASIAGAVLRATTRFVWRQITPAERALLVGEGELAAATRRKLELFPDIHVTVAAVVPALDAAALRAGPELLDGIDRVIVATPTFNDDLLASLLARCRERLVKVSLVPPRRGMLGTAVKLIHVADLPVVEYNTWDVSRSTLLLKRIVDVVLAALLLALLSPLMLAAALLVLADGRPVLFTQLRAGQNGRPFQMRKFRTMVPNAEELLPGLVLLDALPEPVFKLRADPRITRIGRLLRKTSIDELPQLFNVLKGDMSLVGPRPEQMELVSRYTDEQRVRLSIKPGLTGPMQVYGRGRLTFDERLALERDYIEHISLGRDLRILALTVASVLHGRGAF